MVRCPVPVIAAVNGPAVGLGCSLALLSDPALMAEGTYLADPHVQVGPGRRGRRGDDAAADRRAGAARELLFLGGRVSATEAVRLGLANRVVPGDKLLDEAMDLARRLAALPAAALRGANRTVNLHLEHAMATVMETARGAGQHALPRSMSRSSPGSSPGAAEGTTLVNRRKLDGRSASGPPAFPRRRLANA
jgi:enoyl-CoA hydratase/carnithine racemase